MLLCAGMVVVPLASLVHVGDRVPGVRVEASARDDRVELARSATARASRSAARDTTTTEATTSTEAPTTTSSVVETTTSGAPATTAPVVKAAATRTTVVVRTTTTTARPTTTTARPTTTTARPTTTTAPPTTTTTAPPRMQEGDASYYSPSDPAECAHRTLPLGTVVTVTNLENGKKTTCKVGDRGPYVDGRIIDLSQERFADLAPLSDGVIRVRIEW